MKIILKTALLLSLSYQTNALTFDVNVLTDGVDVSPGNGVCEITLGAGDCSLRAAINEANALGGSNIINLDAGVHQLTLAGDEDNGMAGDLNINNGVFHIIGQGPSQTVIDGNSLGTVMQVFNNAEFVLEQVTITGGSASSFLESYGGGLMIVGNDTVARLNSVAVVNNEAVVGGGIYIGGSEVTIINSLIEGNTVDAFDSGLNANAPAVFNTLGVLIIDSSTITDNNASTKAVIIDDGEIYLTNTTISDNQGGGLYTVNSGGEIWASTFHTTTAPNIQHFSPNNVEKLYMSGTVLSIEGATQPTENCQTGQKPTSFGHNVADDSSCQIRNTGDLEDATNIMEPVLANNGGLWPTHNLTPNSPAIDRVPMNLCLDAFDVTLTHDQRGELRPFGPQCDSGAIEYIDSDIIFSDGFGTSQ